MKSQGEFITKNYKLKAINNISKIYNFYPNLLLLKKGVLDESSGI